MANEPEDKSRDDGTIRRAHYGSGKQPWDTIVELGWGPQFAAANVIKYLRRNKEPEHSLESARWYWSQICTRAKRERLTRPWSDVRQELWSELTAEELERLAQ